MPYSRLQYNGDNQYTYKDKRNLLLTQETIEKINNITSGGIDAVVETDSYQLMTLTELAALNDKDAIVEELNMAPYTYRYSLHQEGKTLGGTISEDGETPWLVNGYYFWFENFAWNATLYNGGGEETLQ